MILRKNLIFGILVYEKYFYLGNDFNFYGFIDFLYLSLKKEGVLLIFRLFFLGENLLFILFLIWEHLIHAMA